MARHCVMWAVIAGLVMLMAPGLASAKALKSEVTVSNPDGSSGTAKVVLNYSQGEAGLIANVNASGLSPDATYTVNVGVLVDVIDPVTNLVTGQELQLYGSGTFETKAAKVDDGLKGNGQPKKPQKPKPCKGHVNIHIPWADPNNPPVLLGLTVQITGVANAPQ